MENQPAKTLGPGRSIRIGTSFEDFRFDKYNIPLINKNHVKL